MDNGFAQPGSRRHGAEPADRSDAGGDRRPRSGDRSRPTLLVNPPSDLRLRERLDRTMDEQGPGTPAQLEALMRPEYPRIVVRARSLEHESVIVWYVYREGYWVPATTDEPAATEAPAATGTVGGTGAVQPAAAIQASATVEDERA